MIKMSKMNISRTTRCPRTSGFKLVSSLVLIVFDVNSNVKINSNDLKILFIDENLRIKFRRSVANNVNYKTLQNL